MVSVLSNSFVSTGRSPITLAAGFLGAFIVASMAVQLVRSQNSPSQGGAAVVEPVIASPATLWAPLGERDAVAGTVAAITEAPNVTVEPVVGSEATLWSALGEH